MQAWLLWLESWFRQQRDITACLVMSLLPFPLYLVFLLMPFVAMADPEYQGIYNWEVVPFIQIIVLLCALVLAGVAVYCWSRRRSDEDHPWLSLITVTVTFLVVTSISVAYGYKDSPLMLLCLGLMLLVRALFKAEVYKPISVVLGLMFLFYEIGFWTESLDYAPMLTQPIFLGDGLNAWWAFWLRIIYFGVAIPMLIMFMVLGYFMNREKQELERLVVMDSLTGIHNRSHFIACLDQEGRRHSRRQQPMCVLMCDVDHFKQVNDTWGHPAGDEVLKAVGHILTQSTRATGDVVARFGGEEFVVLLPNTRLSQGQKVGEKIRKYLSHHIFGEGDESFQVTMSIGVAQVNDGDGELALKVADDNLYQAKARGRDQLVAGLAHQRGSLECL
ncbi:GGDEF domain-containing protein [Ketobacter sp.]|uniref:GGDEF domain-containing protein n=1 Tax=Ketobacter sp. TaxID=2083498 RepID=UPI000F274561|nr:GGDEF domain-containing protein [Ketobacter sp.]RLT93052.1 MAG: GGDEF domain-containing protein [Ketobacter sp.]